MPTPSFGTALLILGNSEGLPWTSPTWQGLTQVSGVPWDIQPDGTPDSPAPHVQSWTNRTAESVKTYARNLWAISDTAEQAQYSSRGMSDNDCAGRSAWNTWFQENWNKKWNMNRRIDNVFTEHKCSPYDCMARAKSRKFPSIYDAQVSHQITVPLAYALLGGVAFQGEDPSFLHSAVKTFIDTVIVQTWNRYRKGISRESKQFEKDQTLLETEWKAISQDGNGSSIKDLKSYLTRLRRVLAVLSRYQDQNAVDQLQEQKKTLEAMLSVAQNDGKMKEEIERLPKVLRDTLRKLASEDEVREVEQLLQITLESLDSNHVPIQVEIPEGSTIDFPWKEGTEDLGTLSEIDLWTHLGLDAKCLPFFQEYTDPDGIIDPWSLEGERWLASPENTREVLRPRWHQLVGIYRMIERSFQGEPILLMDGVGIGKTFQVVGLIACLAFYRRFYEKNGKFPGSFGKRKWRGRDGNIPDLPFIVVCPVNLHNQWSREIERFLRRGTFDLFPYTGKLATRRMWWKDIFTQSHHDPSRRIILATESAIQDDASAVFVGILHSIGEEPRKSPTYDSHVTSTVYDRNYLAIIMDEAHVARKLNRLHTAAYTLRQRSEFMVSMTATPVMTKLQDLWIMGHLMGISVFSDRSGYDGMNRELNRAQARDRRAERQSDKAAERLRALLTGQGSHDPRNTNLYPVLQKYIPRLRDAFANNVIRRTLDSVDYLGNKIFGMRPYHENVMLVELHQWEKETLTSLTDQLIENNPLTNLSSAGKNFYIEFRRGLLHPHMNSRSASNSWRKPESLSEWEKEPSTKLDILAKIVHHHLQEDNVRPLKVCEDGQLLQVDETCAVDDLHHPECDRIVVFSAFPSSNAAIRDVLDLYGIKTLELHGKTTPNRRKSVLKEFRSSTRDTGARVLILSMVGTVGLNLACANVMVILDTLWSALDDEQLRGRIYRFPQQKQVYFYRLVARGTPDVFLNNLAFDKGMLHLAFVGMDDKSLAPFGGQDSPLDCNHSDDPISKDQLEILAEICPKPRAIAPFKAARKRAILASVPSNHFVPKAKKPRPEKDVTSTHPNAECLVEPKERIPITSANLELCVEKEELPLALTPGTIRSDPNTGPTDIVSSPMLDLNNSDEDQLMIELFGDAWQRTEDQMDPNAPQSGTSSQPICNTSSRKFSEPFSESTTRSLSPSHPDWARTDVDGISSGIKPRQPRNVSTSKQRSSPPRCDPTVEMVGGKPLIPAMKRRFGSIRSSLNKGKGKGKEKEKE